MKLRADRSPTLSRPGASTLLASSVLARLPLAMFSIALLVHAQRLTGSFGIAGLVSGAYALCSAVAAPQLGMLVDRCGQTRVLVLGATLTALALVIIGILPRAVPPAVLVALGGAAGAATPPLAACVRTLLPTIVAAPDRLPELFAFESTVLEVTFIAGPPLALGLGAVWSTGGALAVTGLIMLLGTLAFAAQPSSRRWRPNLDAPRQYGGALRAPAIRTLVMILFAAGTAFGATEVGVTSATHALGTTAMAGPLLGVWGLGSLLGGTLTTRLGGSATTARELTFLLVALAFTHGALIVATGSVLAIGVIILLAGASIAPTLSSIYSMVDRTAPAGAKTEAYSWVLTASLTGASVGASLGGWLAQTTGPAAAFALVAAASALAVLVALLGSRSLTGAREHRDSRVTNLRATENPITTNEKEKTCGSAPRLA